MKINVNTGKRTPQMRILSAFMAVLIFSLGFLQLLGQFDWGIRVQAADIHLTMKDNEKNSETMSWGTTKNGFTYSGKFNNSNKITMFDYVSDYELDTSPGRGYNICNQKEEGYCDVYTTFNQAISDDHADDEVLSNKIKIIFRPAETYRNENVCIFFTGGTSEPYPLPGERMSYDKGNKVFYFTTEYANLNGSTKFSINDGNNPAKWKTEEIDCPAQGKQITVTQTEENSITIRFIPEIDITETLNAYCWKVGDDGYTSTWPGSPMNKVNNRLQTFDLTNWYNKPNRIIVNGTGWQTKDIVLEDMRSGIVYKISRRNEKDNDKYKIYLDKLISVSVAAQTSLYDTKYTSPLYFACFWQSNEATGYNSTNKPIYNNFWWQANMGLKPQATNGSAAVQGLVENSLTNDGDIQQGGVELPYFNTNWSRSHPELMKYFDKDGNDAISFPFYEVTTSGSSAILKDGSSFQSGERARFYQFNSDDSRLVFDYRLDSEDHDGYFKEQSKDGDTKNGFFPYNSGTIANSSTNNHNLGFGAKFEIDFQLEKDGCVGAVTLDNTNHVVNDSDSATRIHTLFEFEGDDDLWVFIDGQLVLDMGGDHNKSHGIIDFCTRTVSVDKAFKFGTNSSGVNDGSYDDLAAAITAPKTSSFRLAGDDGTSYTNQTHKMTVFYMERGMLDSNLLIRFNYSPIPNLSRMKIAEVTKFDNVNEGLLTKTQKAAENDIFKYTVSNKGTKKAEVLDNTAKFPTTDTYTRTNNALSTQLTPNGTGAAAAALFQPPQTGENTDALDTWGSVANTSYLWVDKFAGMKEGTGKTTDTGDLWLMYGTADILYGNNKRGTESSAEFEKQFSRNSTMKVLQGYNLYNLNRSGTVSLFDNTNALQATENTGRPVADYYTTTFNAIDRNLNAVPINESTGEFTFNNDSSVDENLAPMLTEFFINTVKTGTLTIENEIVNGTANEEFTYTITLNNVFGTGENVSDFSTVKSDKLFYSTNFTYPTVSAGNSGLINSGGTFTLKNHQKLVIQGVPYGTTYKVIQTSKEGVTTTVTGQTKNESGTTSTENIAISMKSNSQTEDSGSGTQLTAKKDHIVHFLNERSMSITAEKTDGNTTGLSGAELELYYRETTTPPTYSFNEPETSPTKTYGMKVNETPNDAGVPAPDSTSSAITTYTYTNIYTNPSVPSSSDTEWILPRSDSDYIYFRDYNVGPNTADKDSQSFSNTTGKRSWIQTNFAEKSAGTHDQYQELGFTDTSLWVAAQFTGTNKKMVQYAVWERFVDSFTYTDTNSTSQTVDTVVWKVQPPDGYDKVRFLVYKGNNCIRTTEEFTFKLGEIYHKTNWGGNYSSAYGGSYYDVPVNDESPNLWAPVESVTADQRNTAMEQPRKYEPTEQKIIFHCNSDNVWHNIHIQFYSDTSRNTLLNDQPFPGYMMEPYAYAGSDYRTVDGYLTYELTIPVGAKAFRITNGAAINSTYGYYTAVTQLRDATTDGGAYKNKKNYANYYCFDTYNDKGGTLKEWSNGPEGMPSANYTTKDVESDYDYIYFEKPTDWNGHIYAYFYGGGDLRADNWQRACYSAWPGVAAAGTEYVDKDKDGNVISEGTYHSNTYTYSTTGDTNNGTGEVNITSPETTFTKGGNTIYKFRIPKGDRKNYSKVIFNDGLKGQSGGNETGVIEYKPGYLYKKNGSSEKYYSKSPTQTYTKKSGLTDGYLYVKVNDTNLATWDNLHITFYNSNGEQILQSGCGYIMDYSGRQTDNSTPYTYFRVPLPADAAMFSVNNGKGSTATGKYDIVSLDSSGSPKATAAADMFVYELSGTTITRAGIVLTRTPQTTSTAETQSEVTTGYTIRKTAGTDDALYIRDTAGWNVPIGGVSVKFYNLWGNLIAPSDNAAYTMIKTTADSGSKVWYTKKIPTGAASFAVSYTKNSTTYTTARYPIYSATANSAENQTVTGDMYYETVGSDTLSLIHAKSTNTESNDETYGKRGDFLYLVSPTVNNDLKVTFYGAGDTTIVSNVAAKYQGQITLNTANPISGKTTADADSVGYWYRVSIPTDAKSFTVTSGGNTTEKADIFELRETMSRYKKDYTLGDMQYRLPATISGSTNTLLYPKFTENTEYTVELGGKTISSRVAPLVDESQVAGFADKASGTMPVDDPAISASPLPVLYETNLNNVVYSWTVEAVPDNMLRYDNTETSWSAVYASFDGGTATAMTHETGTNYWKIAVSDSYSSVVFSDGTGQTGTDHVTNSITLGSSHGANKISKRAEVTTNSAQTYIQSGKVYFAAKSGADNGRYVIFYKTDSSNSVSNWVRISEFWENHSDGKAGNAVFQSPDNINVYWFEIPKDTNGNFTADAVQFMCTNDQSGRGNDHDAWISGSYTDYYSRAIKFSEPDFQSAGAYVYIANNATAGEHYHENNRYQVTFAQNAGTQTTSYEWDLIDYSVSDFTLTYSYQPEDRYGMISNDNSTSDPVTKGTADINDYIYITVPDSITKPYVLFYSDTNGSNYINTTTGTGASAKGLPLNVTADMNMQLNGSSYSVPYTTGTDTKTYKVRLPKNAKSFKVGNGTATGAAFALEGTLSSVYTSNGQLSGGSGDQVNVQNFRHAGSTFSVDSSLAITLSDVRDGYTVSKQAITDPLNPRTDADYVFFTDDASNTMGDGTRKTVYAYFYGDTDGEYSAWPGIKATATNTNVADTTYTDSNGNTVYMFLAPKDTNGKYKYVIFNNGQNDTSRKNTRAIEYSPGRNYVLGSQLTQPYGVLDNTPTENNVYDVASTVKSADPTVNYNTTGTDYIYIINNGTKNLGNHGLSGERYTLDEMHIVFYDDTGAFAGNAYPGYKPDKIIGQQYESKDVYRIQVPSNAKYFRINNGTGKGYGSSHYERTSEMKTISANGLYRFVETASANTDYIEGSTVNDDNSQNIYLLELVNKINTTTEEEIPESTTADIHIATVETGTDGKVTNVKWIKSIPDPNNSSNTIPDTKYFLDPAVTTESSGTKSLNVKNTGEYYWKETKAPANYKLNTTEQNFSLPEQNGQTITIADELIGTKSLTLTKKLTTVKSPDTNAGEGKDFTFTVTLTAPVSVNWDSSPGYPLTFIVGVSAYTPNPTITTNGQTKTFDVSVPASGTAVVISGIPEGTYYNVSETAKTNYSPEPIGISKTVGSDTTSEDAMTGTLTSDTAYEVTNKHKLGTLTLNKELAGKLSEASVDGDTSFSFKVTLTAPSDVDLRDYISRAYLLSIGTITSPADENASINKYEFTVPVSKNSPKTIGGLYSNVFYGIPYGTTYSVEEDYTYSGGSGITHSKTGGAANETLDSSNKSVTVTNTYTDSATPTGQVTLTKTAKEQVGNTNIGAPLSGAVFTLYKSDNTQVSTGHTTDASGQVTITALPYGDYYLEETTAPAGYTKTDSNTNANRRVYFSIGANRTNVSVSCTDEMDAGYIRLFEHINEKLDAWGNPTFIFKIKQTGYYAWSTAETPAWEYTATDSGKEILVALTVNDDGTITDSTRKVLKWIENVHDTENDTYTPTNRFFDADAIDNNKYGDWLVEATSEDEYIGVFDIDELGRIRVEPGSYEITRVPVSRYEFVTNGKTETYPNDTEPGNWTEYKVNGNKSEKMLIGEKNNENEMVGLLEPGKTIDVHYYDQVAYYDKFSQVDETINKFYQLDSNHKNITVKGIRIADYHQVGTTTIGSTAADTVEVTDDTTNPATTTQTMTVPVGNLKIFKIMSDGSEVEMTSAEKAALTNFNITYTYDSNSGDKREFGGKAAEGADPAVPAQFSYNTSDKQIVVTDAADFQNGVYTLKATYDNKFSTNFDLVFERTP